MLMFFLRESLMVCIDFLDGVFAFFLIDFYAQFSFLFLAMIVVAFVDSWGGVLDHFLLQGIFPTQGLNPGLQHSRQML